MHRDRIMPQRFLREAFGIAAGFGSFRPSVTVAMERDTPNSKSIATLFEFRRPVTGTHPRQIRKKQTFARQILERVQSCFAQMKNHRNARLFPGEADGSIFPIHVLGLQTGDVTLAAAKMPAQLIKRFPLRIFLPADDGLMFGKGDGALIFEVNRRPLTFGNDRAGNQFMSRAKF